MLSPEQLGHPKIKFMLNGFVLRNVTFWILIYIKELLMYFVWIRVKRIRYLDMFPVTVIN